MARELRLLMIEDSDDDGMLVVRELQRAGYQMTYERLDTPSALVAALENREWDLVIADFNMPGFTGTEALKMVRDRQRDLPFVFVSGTIGEQMAVAAMKAGANDYVMKGNLARLVPAIEREMHEAIVRRERRRMAEELRLSEERFAKVFRASPVGIAVFTADGLHVIDTNDAFARILRPDPAKDVREDAITEIWSSIEEREQILARLQDHGSVRDVDLEIRRADQTRCPVLASFERFELGGQQCLLVMLHDIGERQRLETQLQRAQKMEAVGRLAGGLAHDFNNMVTVMLGFTDLILGDIPENSPHRANLKQVKAAAERAAALTRQLLTFSRSNIRSPQVFDLNDALASTATMIGRLIREDIQLRVIPHGDPCSVYADLGQLEQVIVNLAVNARDAMTDGGTLMLETAKVEIGAEPRAEYAGLEPGTWVVLTVSDTGSGMSAETQARVFEPFFTTKAPGHGTGLGLATSYAIIKQIGGEIRVRSEAGLGATFTIYLPLVNHAPAAVAPPVAVEDSLRGSETVLVVEDDRPVRELLRYFLQTRGYRVIEAQNGLEALLIIEQSSERIDLMITDVIMPGMGGQDLVRFLRAERSDIRVLYMSGYAGEGFEQDSDPASGGMLLEKPFTSESLARKVREVLSAPAIVSEPASSHRAGGAA